jgi:hypothetical protein
MKNKKLIICTILSIFVISQVSFIYSKGTTSGLLKKIGIVTQKLDNAGYMFNLNKANITVLERDKNYRYKVQLYKGIFYAIGVAGDETAKEIDVKIYDEKMKEIVSKSKTDALALVEIDPKYSGTYTVQVTFSKSRDVDIYFWSVLGWK